MSFPLDFNSAAMFDSHCQAAPIPCFNHAVLLKNTAQHGRRETTVLCRSLVQLYNCTVLSSLHWLRRESSPNVSPSKPPPVLSTSYVPNAYYVLSRKVIVSQANRPRCKITVSLCYPFYFVQEYYVNQTILQQHSCPLNVVIMACKLPTLIFFFHAFKALKH